MLLFILDPSVLLGFGDRVQSADAIVQLTLQHLSCYTLASELESASEENPGMKVWEGIRVNGGDYPELLQLLDFQNANWKMLEHGPSQGSVGVNEDQ